jgi:hypothetical protein
VREMERNGGVSNTVGYSTSASASTSTFERAARTN